MYRQLLVLLACAAFYVTSSVAQTNATAWQRLSGPSGGPVNVLLTAPSNPTRLYANTNNGLFISNDSGASWARVGNLPDNINIQLQVAPDNADRLYAYGSLDGQLAVSDDAGRSWTNIATGIFIHLAISPARADTLYSVTYRNENFSLPILSVSDDAGLSWRQLNLPAGVVDIRKIILAPNHADRLYLDTIIDQQGLSTTALYRSSDGGLSWSSIDSGLPFIENLEQFFIVDNDGQRLLAVIRQTATAFTPESEALLLYLSQDGGLSWQAAGGALPAAENLQPQPIVVAKNIAASGTLYATQLQFLGLSQRSTLQLYRSDDLGSSWRPIAASLPGNLDVVFQSRLITAENDADRLFLFSPTGIYKSTDGGNSWRLQNNGLDTANALRVVTHPAHSEVLYASYFATERLFYSNDSGINWRSAQGDLPEYNALYGIYPWPGDSHTVYTMIDTLDAADDNDHTFGTRIFRSEDAGLSWQALTPPPTPDIRGLVLDPENRNTLYVISGDVLWASDDGGISWQRRGEQNVTVLALDPQQTTRLYAYQSYPEQALYRSDDSGKNWQKLNVQLPLHRGVQSLFVDPRDTNTLYMSLTSFIRFSTIPLGTYRSQDGGRSWQALTDPSRPINIEQAIFKADNSDTSFLTYSNDRLAGQFFRHSDSGWLALQSVGSGIADFIYASDGAISADGSKLYAATTRGIFMRAAASISDAEIINVSTRGIAGPAGQAMHVGFIVQNRHLSLLMKGEGAILGRSDVIGDPLLMLAPLGGVATHINDNWRDDPFYSIVNELAPPASDREAAFVAYLEPGAYTLSLSNQQPQSALGLAAATERDAFIPPGVTAVRYEVPGLVNVSTRGLSFDDERTLHIGFIIQGTEPLDVILSAQGPVLNTEAAIDDPLLQLMTLTGEILLTVDDWREHASAEQVAALVTPASDREALAIVSLMPGAYILRVTSKNGLSGEALGAVTDIRAFKR